MLTQSQKDRLQLIHSYEWVTEVESETRSRLAQLYADVESTEELWFASFIIVLDIDEGQLQLVLDHPLCDRGIACLIYCGYANYDSETSKQLLKELESRLLNGYYKPKIRFNESLLHQGRTGRRRQVIYDSAGDLCLPLDYDEAVFGKT